jgi:4-amino-4-deoxy-L-arabinose transferase-like glycosyltransferase
MKSPAIYEDPGGPLPAAGAWSLSITKLDWGPLLAVLVFAALLRLLFFSGGLGTDEIVYLTHAHHLLRGDYLHTGYIGGMRDGINAFLAASLWLFGKGVAGAGGLFFACSLGQVTLAYGFAHHLWGRQAALWAGLAMAALPIEVTQAGGLNPDPYLGFVIGLSVVTFYFAERDDRPGLYFVAGMFAGWVYWIKQVVVLYGIVFIFLAVTNRRLRWNWIWFVFGGALLVIAQLVLFEIAYHDPFYFFKVNYQFIIDAHISGNYSDTSLFRYFILLFIYIYHTGLLGWLALVACVFSVSTTGAARIAVRADMVLRTDLHFHRVPDFFLTP